MSYKDFPAHHDIFQANVWPAMRETLAAELHIFPDALRRIGLGYVPSVQFKKQKLHLGWWTFPQRDIQGNVTGIALRGRDGRKLNLPGSKGGLFYEPNPEAASNQPRRQFVRTVDAGVSCPVCGKPDGCLLSDDDLDDPSDVVCCRVQKGSSRPFQIGFLHHRKGVEYHGEFAPVLPPSDHPVVVVEGPTCAAAAMSMGFVSIGRPGANSFIHEITLMLKGRDVIVVGENDTKSRVGQTGLEATADALAEVCKSVRRCSPPEHINDLRDWYVESNLTAESFLAYAHKHGVEGGYDRILADDSPVYIAQRWLQENHTDGDLPILRQDRGQWFRFDGVCYREVNADSVVRGGLYQWLDGRHYHTENSKGEPAVKRYVPTRSRINDVVDALNTVCPVETSPPCWLDDREEPDPVDLIAFQNCLLDVQAYLNNDTNAQLAPTPHLFSTFALPYDFDPDATCPTWENWLGETLGDEPDKIALLQEWFGYCLLPDTHQEKFMMLVGRSGSGKSTAIEVLRALVGHDQMATTSFGSLATDSGKAPLVGKLVAAMPDARLPVRTDPMHALENLLMVTSGDGVPIKRKYLPDIADHKLVCRVIMAVNELPELPDNAQALMRRVLMLHFNNSFVGQEDRTLKDRLVAEAPGIAVWALHGLARLRDTQMFTFPQSSAWLTEEFRRVTSPVVDFVEECCTLYERDKASIPTRELYDSWARWAQEKALPSGKKRTFINRLLAAYPHLDRGTEWADDRKQATFFGIKLQDWAKRQYLGVM